MASMVNNIFSGNGGVSSNGDPTALTAAQSKVLTDAGLKPGTEEYNKAAIQAKLENLSQTMSAVANAFKKMDDVAMAAISKFA